MSLKYPHRVAALRRAMEANQLDALLVSRRSNVRYLSGFSGSAGDLVVTSSRVALLTDSRYTLRAATEAPGTWVRVPESRDHDILREELADCRGARVGYEPNGLTVAAYKRVCDRTAGLDLTWVESEGHIETLRLTKDAEEIAALRTACVATDLAYRMVASKLAPGHTEREVEWLVQSALHECGSDGLAFDIIVASGPNSASPHHEPTDRLLQRGDLVTLDFGARHQGYCADITRTVMLGECDADLQQIHRIVCDALDAAIRIIRPGIEAGAVDAAARQVITDAGYGPCFTHSTGHSLGLDVHDGPGFSAMQRLELAPGMVMTVEPGIYLQGHGGVRVEDDVLITETGCERLTHSSRSIHPEEAI